MPAFATVQDYVDSLPESQREIADTLLPLIDAALPGAGAVWHGHPVWSLGAAPGKATVCHVKSYPKYLTFGLFRGQEIADAAGRLEAGSRTMASVKLRSTADIDGDLFADWLRQAREVEQSAARG
ncbi:DUF1801 domain-containing protein [Solihabitans fulvus]|uniref:DUF1801 domain-containing protein n=1 Tax=Solihabitans fulvus TaxID=1892852 RepID=A0A5B2X433_9PSEU|nr:DUF1801 domain-containing protein [Solihabitans fulvus]KAA2257910.1 DUF1801 domain-containing protein [Solihabitans fulvus]